MVPRMRPLTALLALIVTVCSSACSSSPPGAGTAATVDVSPPPPADSSAPAPSATPATTASTAPVPPAPSGDLAGTWSSPSCGARGYERVLDLRSDGTFTASDRVSPCPPGARCVWSGIVVREGTWASAGGRVVLTITRDGKGPAGQALPGSLALDGGGLVEDGGGQRCPYTRR